MCIEIISPDIKAPGDCLYKRLLFKFRRPDALDHM